MAGEGTAQGVHLRTACDPCSTAKVRCDKKHPVCDRCLQIKLPCSYSQSRKHGKQSWRRKLAYNRFESPAIDAYRTTTPATPPIISQMDEPVLDNLLQSPVGPLLDVQDLFLDYSQRGHGGSLALGSTWPFGDGTQSAIEIDVGPVGNWEFSGLLPAASPIGDNLNVTGPSQSVATLGTSPESTSSSNHDCEAQAVSILRSMQHGEMCPGATSGSTDPGQYADLNRMPSFDRVLSINKDALNGWSKLMECSCASCPHLMILYVSILSKMMFWYRIAAAESSQLSVNTEASNEVSSSIENVVSSPSMQVPPTASQFSVRPTIIQVGMLNLDAEDQANLRRILLLRELRRAKAAIEELIPVDRLAVEAADEVVRHSLQWSIGGIVRVKEELHDLIQRLSQLR
ncbi:hypothetical protein F4824DRAFT_511214 [Ustulina deusta]|nr:hypothetical protein F4824DRAFT_511214 [Ustulina deusta]